eukprot:4464548-Amphidinium_carterae.1
MMFSDACARQRPALAICQSKGLEHYLYVPRVGFKLDPSYTTRPLSNPHKTVEYAHLLDVSKA